MRQISLILVLVVLFMTPASFSADNEVQQTQNKNATLIERMHKALYAAKSISSPERRKNNDFKICLEQIFLLGGKVDNDVFDISMKEAIEGNEYAQLYLGMMASTDYLKDDALEEGFFLLAASQDNMLAVHLLGYFYLDNADDNRKSSEYFEKAYRLAKEQPQCEYPKKDSKYKTVNDLILCEASKVLADIYNPTHDKQRIDLVEAEKWARIALSHGYQEAEMILQTLKGPVRSFTVHEFFNTRSVKKRVKVGDRIILSGVIFNMDANVSSNSIDFTLGDFTLSTAAAIRVEYHPNTNYGKMIEKLPAKFFEAADRDECLWADIECNVRASEKGFLYFTNCRISEVTVHDFVY